MRLRSRRSFLSALFLPLRLLLLLLLLLLLRLTPCCLLLLRFLIEMTGNPGNAKLIYIANIGGEKKKTKERSKLLALARFNVPIFDISSNRLRNDKQTVSFGVCLEISSLQGLSITSLRKYPSKPIFLGLFGKGWCRDCVEPPPDIPVKTFGSRIYCTGSRINNDTRARSEWHGLKPRESSGEGERVSTEARLSALHDF